MAKKKKKSRGDVGSDVSLSISSPKGSSASASEQHDDPLLDFMMLEIVASSTPPFPKALQYVPIILLTGEDADDMGLVTGDCAFLLSEKAETIESTTLARVHVVLSSSSSSSSSSTKSPSGFTKIQRSKLSSGYCHVYPQSLAQQLQGRGIGESEQVVVEARSTPSPSISTPSPSKSKFSFARGGGGDLMISSPSSSNTPKCLPSKNRKSNALWVVPVESTLGERLTKMLCSTATSVTINAITTTTTSSSDTKVLKGSLGPPLIRAHLLSSYVSLGTTVAISVQGISTPCQVTDVQSIPTLPTLEEDMSTLSLKELHLNAESHQLLSHVHASLRFHESKPASQNHIRLFQITRDTTITFGDSSSTSDTTTNQSNASLSSPISLLAGLDETIDKVQSLLLTPLVHPELFQSNPTLRPPKGVLLYGSSGAGKSTLASQVAQTLHRTHNIHIHELSCAKLQSQTSLVGQAEKALARAFEAASQQSHAAASLIVLDDVHLICPRRQGMNVGADRLAATLLALLDGVESTHKRQKQQQQQKEPLVMVLAVTNNPSLLDPALRRPGRLDTEVEVPLPDEPGTRSLILQFHLQRMGVQVTIENKSDEWIRLARLAKGFTGADLQLAVKEAIRLSVLRKKSKMPIPQQETQHQSSTFDLPISVDTIDLESAIRSIKPSAIKAVSVEIPQVHWSSIGGMDEVKRQLREAVELPLTHAAMFQKLNIRPPKGVLLYGPPGCSKTLMARALATEGHMNFLAVKGPELLSKWLGESERALASLFRRARLASPSIIFFDEVDAIATKRGGGSSGGGERLLSQLLTELDGIQSGGGDSSGDQNKHRVMVICATNRPDLLDSALMRPGRIDRMIYVGVPDMASRLRILEIGLQGKSCKGDLDLAYLARDDISGGLSGAELVSACRDAALLALEEHEGQQATLNSPPSIGMSHLIQAIEKTERQITPAMIDFYKHFQGLESDL